MPQLDHCCLCSLLCPAVPVSDETSLERCTRRQAWQKNSRHAPHSIQDDSTLASFAREVVDLLDVDQSLLWVDAADVNTMRAAVTLAQQLGCTLHVGQGTGAEVVKRVTASEGWLSTTLAEVSARADLVITLGDSILSEAPLLADRFLHRAGAAAGEVVQLEWMHIGSPSSTPPKGCSQVIELGRTAWYAELTDLLLALRSGQASLLENSPLTPLYARLQTARYAVWLWETDEFVDSIDELTVRRLAALARWQTEQARGSLLCLDSNLGRVTAEETLLWLTGCKTTARWDGAQWHSPPSLREYSMDDWRQAFAARLILRSVPTVEPLPDLDASILIVPAGQALTASAGDRRVIRVPAVGESSCGLLFRGDRGTVATVRQACAAGPAVGGAVESSRTSRQSATAPSDESLASAEALLRRAAELREPSRIRLPNQSGSANHAH